MFSETGGKVGVPPHCGKQNNRDNAGSFHVLEPESGIVSVHIAEIIIHKDQVRARTKSFFNTVFAAVGALHLKAVLAEKNRHQRLEIPVVLYYQYLFHLETHSPVFPGSAATPIPGPAPPH